MRHNEDIILKRKREENRLGKTKSRMDEVIDYNVGVVS